MLEHFNLVAVRLHVNLLGPERNGLRLAVFIPRDGLRVEVHTDFLRHIDDLRVLSIDAVAFGLQVHQLAAACVQVLERVTGRGVSTTVDAVFLTVVAARKRQCTTGMFLFGHAEQVGRVTQLRLDFFLAVTEIVIRQHGHDHAALVARRQLECLAIIVQFIGGFPAHAVVLLSIGGLADMRQAGILLGHSHQVRGEDHATGRPGPVFHVECRIEFCQVRVAAVAENTLDEIQVADQVTGRQEMYFHGLLRVLPGNFRTYHRAQ